ncbi:hypothetical protein [Micromonospora sp. CA-246542]|uniref:hypothetical protein n=1 Tax=Micromonospora sp. CA-246542 TaxID=3239959 RepID=UPI003D9451BB
MSTVLFTRRARWQALTRQRPAPTLRVALLASYTADPLVPYLGLDLHERGLSATLTVGPFQQVVQQCLATDGFLADVRPDVLVVAQRLEEAGEPGAAGDAWATELVAGAEAAVTAARRHGALLVYVLPAIPTARPSGPADAMHADGLVASATVVRQRLRDRLAGEPWVLLVDADEAVRAVGDERAHHPVLFRLAKVPYTEEVFARLGASAATLVASWFGAGCRALVVDGDGLTGAAHLLPALRELRAAGVRVALRATGDGCWSDGDAVDLLSVLDGWVTDDRPIGEQLADIAAELDVAPAQIVLAGVDAAQLRPSGEGPTGEGPRSEGPTGAGPTGERPTGAGPTGERPTGAGPTGERPTGEGPAVEGPPRRVLLGADPAAWSDELRAAGLTDRLPERRWSGGPARSAAAPHAALALDDFVAGLDVQVDYLPVVADGVAEVAEVVARAHDFALTSAPPAAALAARADDLLAIRVRDRLGDYGTSGLVALDRGADRWTVDVFSLSCPVLGKGVEAAVLRELTRRAGAAGADEVVVRWTDTGRNGTARRFLSEVDGLAPADPRVRLRAARASVDPTTGSGTADAATPDASTADAGTADAATADAGTADAATAATAVRR